MKKATIIILLLAMTVCLCTCAWDNQPISQDYITLMTDSAHEGKVSLGHCAERLRGVAPGEDTYISFDELYLLSRFLDSEYTYGKYTPQLRSCVAEVVLNRMEHEGVEMVQAIEGMGADMDAIEAITCPTRESLRIVLRLLQGERDMQRDVLIISDKQEGTVYATFRDRLLGDTYFCIKAAPTP